MPRSFVLSALAMLFAAQAQGAPPSPIQVSLRFLRAPSKRTPGKRVFLPAGFRYLQKLTQPPPGRWKLPELRAEIPVFSLLDLAGKKHLLVLDKKSPKSSFYDRLYIDADGDGDLTGDLALDASSTRTGGNLKLAMFQPIQLELSLPGGKGPYVFRIYAYMRPVTSTPGKKQGKQQRLRGMTFYMTPLCAYGGSFQLEGKTYRILLADTNADGWFGSEKEVSTGYGRKKRDLVYISRGTRITYQDGMEAQGLLGLGTRLFRPRFRQAEGKLTLEPLGGTTARLRLPMRVSRLVLLPAGASAGIMWFDPAGEIAVPPGAYRLGSYQALREDDGGNQWILRAAGDKKTPPVTARPAGTADLRFGEPFVPKVAVYARFPKLLRARSVAARLTFLLLGSGGERVTDIRSMTYKKSSVPRSPRSRYRPLEPTYKILELPSLSLAAQGSFHYG